MSETTTYQPALGITVRQRISVKQTAKGEFTRDYTVEISAPFFDVKSTEPDDAWVGPASDKNSMHYLLSELNEAFLRRAEADWSAHVERIKAGDGS